MLVVADLRGLGAKCVYVAPCHWGARSMLVYMRRRVAGERGDWRYIGLLLYVGRPCVEWTKGLQCGMDVFQFDSNLFSVVLAQPRLALLNHNVALPLSAPPHLCTFTSSQAHIRRSTSLPPHTHTSAHLYHIYTSTLSLLHIRPLFLSFYISFLLI